ncbi:MAG TPA: NHL repeat-containing protein [Solirubrobacteraceae bacterium]
MRRHLAPHLLVLLLAAGLALCGCGSADAPRPAAVTLAAACPGAVGPKGAALAHCPYTGIRAIGRRGEGVLRCPEALAFAPDGTLYVADQFSHIVQRFSPSGRFLGQWGSYGSGLGQLGAVDGLAVSAHGEVYVLDASHDRIERFSATGRLLGEWGSAGHALGQFDFGAGQGPDKPPGGAIAIGAGHVYVADSANDRIVRYDLDGSHAVLWAGPGSGPGQLSSPRGLTVARGVVYVADEGNHRVQALDLQGRPLYVEGTFGKGPGQFVNPFGVVAHGARVYVVDDNNNRIAVLTRALHPLGEWSGEGRYHLSYIRAAAVDSAGHVYVADTGNEQIVAFDGSGRGLRMFGTPGITPGQLIAPLAVASDRSGGVLVAETFGSRSPVYLFDSQLRYRTVWERGGGAIIGSHWFGPSSAAFAADGSAWIADPRNDTVRHLDADGHFLGSVGPTGLLEPEGVAIAPSGELDVANTGRGEVARFSPDGHPLGALGVGLLRHPVAVAVARSGNLYVADSDADRVLVLSSSGALLASWGGPGRAPGHFGEPAGIAVDRLDHVFVADRDGGHIEEFTSTGRLRAVWGVDGGAAGELSRPSGVAIDCHGDVLVADTQNNRVQIFEGAAAPSSCGGV